jgi:hypothetical protein
VLYGHINFDKNFVKGLKTLREHVSVCFITFTPNLELHTRARTNQTRGRPWKRLSEFRLHMLATVSGAAGAC